MVELLAPAGSREALVAAVENGANAIYLAGNAFGARAYASNFDREALRVAKMMPKWKPGLNNNKPCRTLFAVPIDFKL